MLRERWGLVDTVLEPHEGPTAGMDSRTWWVTTDVGPSTRRYVAKWVADDAVGSLAAGVAAAALAETSGVATGAPLEMVGGDRVLLVEGGSMVLLHRVEGEPLDGSGPDDAAVVGATLARVHAATAGQDLVLGLRWPWVEPDGPHLADRPDQADLRAAVVGALAAVEALGPLVTGVAHGDPAPEAFLRCADGSTALIDWASALAGPLLYDVVSAVMYLGGLDAAEPLVASYAGAGGAAAPDLPHLATMLRFRWAVQADYFARRVATGDVTGTGAAGDEKGLEDARRGLLGGS